MVLKQSLDRKGRYRLRELRHADYHRLREMNIDLFFAPLRHQFGPVGFLQAAIRQQRDAQRTDYFMGVADAKTDQLIGSIMVFDKKPLADGTNSVEIGYFIDPLHQKLRFATDATVELLQKLKEKHRISQVVATVDPANKPSRKILMRLGFKRIGYAPESKYRANPDQIENYADNGDLKFAPRIYTQVPITTLFAKAAQIVQPAPRVVAQRISDARRDAAQRVLDHHRAERSLKAYLQKLHQFPSPW